ncbi:MAG: GNAT family N-acetyltransferase [Proteobacteria bacterium]|nr:GNAT family N-acetyltransferase [Pseudomonadota bacterium]
MDAVEIRTAGPGDVPALASLVAAFRDHLGVRGPTAAALAAYLPGLLRDERTELACAWDGADALGYTNTRFFSSLWATAPEAHLEDLFVVAAARGRGVGRQLLRHALSRARERGAVAFGLQTNERNLEAQALYRAEGLRPDSHARYPDGREVYWVRRLEPR